MSSEPPIPEELWAAVPPGAQAALLAAFAALQQQIDRLTAEVARLTRDSSNSHRPPSSDLPGAKPAPPRKPSGNKPGGQPGHARLTRVRLPATRTHDYKPSCCGGCGHALGGDDPDPRWRQVWELPPIAPAVTEYRAHALRCECCGAVTAAAWPDAVPTDGYGPRLKAAVAYCTGSLHLSKAQAEALCEDLLGVPLSTGQVCAIEAQAAALLGPVVAQLKQAVPGQHANVDETGWKQSGVRCWLWVAVTASFTVFHLAFSRGRRAAEELLGAGYQCVATTDRWSAYNHLARRQLCWAHLRRDFQALIDGGGAGRAIGEELLFVSDLMFSVWHRVRDGTLTRRVAGRRILSWYAPDFRVALEQGRGASCGPARALCGDLLKRWGSLWTFCEVEGVEPTNNAAERALRPAVLWRRTSQGTRAESGSRYVSVVLSVSATCRQQGRRLWDYLTEAFRAADKGQPAPSLLPSS